MVFWKTYPILNILKSKLNNRKFTDLKFNRDKIESPTGIDAILLHTFDSNKLSQIKLFLKQYFGEPPKTPILNIPERELLKENDLILYVVDKNKEIAGCIRYHYLGHFLTDNNQDIYCEDCFCIHPSWRKKGVGDYLLTTLHTIVNKSNKPYSMFLKEGKSLGILNQSFYSGMYAYKEVEKNATPNITNLTKLQVTTLIKIFLELNKNTFVIKNTCMDNQNWILYKKSQYAVIACIQDTYQYFQEDEKIKKIGWITCWLESPNMNDTIRAEASHQISNSAYGMFDYIWVNKVWVGNSTEWKEDGPFHWYLYQWSTNINIKTQYCITQ